MHTGRVSDPLPSPTEPGQPPAGGWAAEIIPIVATAHAVWAQAPERRRMRAYGFRPAVEDGVLKREWHGLTIRVSGSEIRARHARGELRYDAEDGDLLFDGHPFDGGAASLEVAELVVSLINDYERWVEVREGRASRLRRTAAASSDRRPINAIAETRRLQRLLGSAWGRPPTRRR